MLPFSNLRSLASRYKTFLFLAFSLAAVTIIHVKSITQFPVSRHAWTQSDWYALSLGFLDNGMDFFHPQTYVLNPLPVGQKGEPEGITAVDFPIHPYLAACIMKITGSNHPVIFRSLSLLLSLIGLYSLFLAIRNYSDNFWFAAAGTCFFLFEPTFAYYQDGFIPSFHALSHYLIGIYFFSGYFSDRKNKTWRFTCAILFFTIAALTRFPYIIHLIAILIVLAAGWWKIHKIRYSELFPILLGIMTVTGYFLYNIHLSTTYGSAFLNHPLPATGPGDFFNCIYESVRYNIRTVFPPVHLLLLGVFIYMIVKTLRQGSKSSSEKIFFNYLVISFAGITAYTFLMIKQFPAHDYYAADTILPALAGVFIFGSRFIKVPQGGTWKVVIIFFIAGAFNVCLEYQLRMYSKERLAMPESQTLNNFEGSLEFLSAHGISKNSPVLVVGSYEPNIPFIQLRRKGYQVRQPEHDSIQEALKLNYECAITQNGFFSEVEAVFPDWNKIMRPFATNGKITLWHPVEKVREK